MRDYDRRLAAALQEMEGKGLRPTPAFRLLRRCGMPVRPTLYMGLWSRAVGEGAAFAVLWGLMMRLLPGGGRTTVASMALAALIAGALYGPTMSLWLRRRARRLGLSAWEDL